MAAGLSTIPACKEVYVQGFRGSLPAIRAGA